MPISITEIYKTSFINAVIEAIQELYNYIHNELKEDDLEYSNVIGFGGDNSLYIDLIAEEIFIKHLKSYSNIYSEECGYLDFNKDFTSIIDPLDGSENFYSGLEYYGCSIALQDKNQTIAGFVCNLATGFLVYKAFDNKIIEFNLSNKIILSNKKISKFGIFERAYKFPKITNKLHEKSIKYRSLGAAAISLSTAYKYDFVLFAGEIREFDVAASLYICNGLFLYKSEKYLLLTKNKHKFDIVKEIIKEE